jgi:uncharacterized protein
MTKIRRTLARNQDACFVPFRWNSAHIAVPGGPLDISQEICLSRQIQVSSDSTQRRIVNMPNVIHFEIGVDDLEAAVTFYSRVFDWKIEKAEDGSDYWHITTGNEDDPGITGGLGSRFDEWNPTVNTIEVSSIDSCATKIAESGGKILAPKFSIPGMGDVQYCQDPEGNTFGIMEYYKYAD